MISWSSSELNFCNFYNTLSSISMLYKYYKISEICSYSTFCWWWWWSIAPSESSRFRGSDSIISMLCCSLFSSFTACYSWISYSAWKRLSTPPLLSQYWIKLCKSSILLRFFKSMPRFYRSSGPIFFNSSISYLYYGSWFSMNSYRASAI